LVQKVEEDQRVCSTTRCYVRHKWRKRTRNFLEKERPHLKCVDKVLREPGRQFMGHGSTPAFPIVSNEVSGSSGEPHPMSLDWAQRRAPRNFNAGFSREKVGRNVGRK